MSLELPLRGTPHIRAVLHYSQIRHAINARSLLLKLARSCLIQRLLAFALASLTLVHFDAIASSHDAACSILQTAIRLIVSLIEWFGNRGVLSHQYFDFYGLFVEQ